MRAQYLDPRKFNVLFDYQVRGVPLYMHAKDSSVRVEIGAKNTESISKFINQETNQNMNQNVNNETNEEKNRMIQFTNERSNEVRSNEVRSNESKYEIDDDLSIANILFANPENFFAENDSTF